MPGYSHTNEQEKLEQILDGVKKAGTIQLLMSYGSLLATPQGQPVVLPITVGEERTKGNLNLGQGLERMVTMKAIVEELAIRIDGGKVR